MVEHIRSHISTQVSKIAITFHVGLTNQNEEDFVSLPSLVEFLQSDQRFEADVQGGEDRKAFAGSHWRQSFAQRSQRGANGRCPKVRVGMSIRIRPVAIFDECRKRDQPQAGHFFRDERDISQ